MTKEIEHLKLLDIAIKKFNLKNIVILYRPHPWGLGWKGGESIIKHKWKNIVIEQSMISYLKNLSKGIKIKELKDPLLMHNILSNVDGIISPLSTVLLEAAIHGKPSICLLPYEDKSNHFMHDVELTHFHDFFRSDLFIKVSKVKDLPSQLNNLIKLTNNNNIKNQLIDFSRYFVDFYKVKYAKRLYQFIKNLI